MTRCLPREAAVAATMPQRAGCALGSPATAASRGKHRSLYCDSSDFFGAGHSSHGGDVRVVWHLLVRPSGIELDDANGNGEMRGSRFLIAGGAGSLGATSRIFCSSRKA